jgi:hypothetical protein
MPVMLHDPGGVPEGDNLDKQLDTGKTVHQESDPNRSILEGI